MEFSSEDGAVAALRFPDTLELHGAKLTVKPREFKLRKGKKKGERVSESEDITGQGGHLGEETMEGGAQVHSVQLPLEQVEAIILCVCVCVCVLC